MTGWHISVFRQPDGSRRPADWSTLQGDRVAVWQTGSRGLDWLDALARDEKAIDLRGNGYPNRYTAPPRHLLGPIIDGPPEAREVWLSDPHDVLTEKWVGRTLIDHEVARSCRDGEWLLVEAWDES